MTCALPDSDRAEDEHGPGSWCDIGALVDVAVDQQQWREAVVVSSDGAQRKVRILFETGEKWVDGDKILRYGSKTFTPWSEIKAGALVDVQNLHPARKKFWKAQVLKKLPNTLLQVALCGENGGVVEVPSKFVFPYGSKTYPGNHQDNVVRREFASLKTQGVEQSAIGRSGDIQWPEESDGESKENAQKRDKRITKKRQRGILAASEQYLQYIDALKKRELLVERMEGDGNCMFRAISHQVYGTPEHHIEVRQYCMDYMESESEYFEPFVVGNAAAFAAYIDRKRKDGVWGDDIELQAICEIYDRPIQVFAYDPMNGARMLRTFHEDSRHRAPIVLSFYGGGHYDSVVGPNFDHGLERRTVGVVEEWRIRLSRHRRSEGDTAEYDLLENLSENQVLELAIQDDAIQSSRLQYCSAGVEDLDTILKLSLQVARKEEERLVEQTLIESTLAQEELQALEASDIDATEQAELEQAIKLSKLEENADSDSKEDEQLAAALRLSEEEFFGDGNTNNQSDSAASRVPCSETDSLFYPALDFDLDEDEMLQRAIQASLAKSV